MSQNDSSTGPADDAEQVPDQATDAIARSDGGDVFAEFDTTQPRDAQLGRDLVADTDAHVAGEDVTDASAADGPIEAAVVVEEIPAAAAGVTAVDESAAASDGAADAAAGSDDAAAMPAGAAAAVVEPPQGSQFGVLGFTIRELTILGAWALAFVFSFFPIFGAGGPRFASQNVWTSGPSWVLMIGVPTVAVFLIVLRRFSPQGIRRVGSLGVDQFASVAFSVAAVLWLENVWSALASGFGSLVYFTWVNWVESVLFLVLVVASVFAPLIPVFAEDFRARPEVPAHPAARAVRRVVARPAREVVPAEATAGGAAESFAAGAGGWDHAASNGASVATADPEVDAWAAPEHTTAQPVLAAHPFWALVPEERDVLDEQTGAPLFRIGPTAWALVVEDRGSSFVVRHDDGRVGVLSDVSGVTRG